MLKKYQELQKSEPPHHALDQPETPMENPYQAPGHNGTDQARTARGKLHDVVCVLIALFCILQFVGVWALVLRFVKDHGLDEMPILLLAQKTALPFTLALGGVFLVFGRRLAAIFFAVYLVQYAVAFGANGKFNVLTVALAMAFLAYALWLWKVGLLRGWPGK